MRYLRPLIAGEDYPRYKNGVPEYGRLKQQRVAKKLPEQW
jgi:6-phosphofructokinase 1